MTSDSEGIPCGGVSSCQEAVVYQHVRRADGLWNRSGQCLI